MDNSSKTSCVPTISVTCATPLDPATVTDKIRLVVVPINPTAITDKARMIVVDWMFEVGDTYSVSFRAIQTAIAILDRYLQVAPMTRNRLQTLGVACLYVASNFDGSHLAFDMEDAVHVCPHLQFTPNLVSEMCVDVLKKVGFNILGQTALIDLVKERTIEAGWENRNDLRTYMAMYLSLEAMMHRQYGNFRQDRLAQACVDLALFLIEDGGFFVNFRRKEIAYIYKCWVDVVDRDSIDDNGIKTRIMYELFCQERFCQVTRKATPPDKHRLNRKDRKFNNGTICLVDPMDCGPSKEAVPFLNNFIARYTEGQLLGSGTFGTVHSGTTVRKGKSRQVAVKKFIGSGEISYDYMREVYALSELSHPNIVKMRGVFFEGVSRYHIVMELLGPTLHKVFLCTPLGHSKDMMCAIGGMGMVDTKTPFTLKQKFAMIVQLLEGVDHMHSKGIMHRDLCPKNIAFNLEKDTLKIFDFGSSKRIGSPTTPQNHTDVVTKYCYRAPEVYDHKKYDGKIDIWACACIIFEILVENRCFPICGEEECLLKIFKRFGKVADQGYYSKQFIEKSGFYSSCMDPTGISEIKHPQVQEILTKMFSYNPQSRPTAREACEMFRLVNPK